MKVNLVQVFLRWKVSAYELHSRALPPSPMSHFFTINAVFLVKLFHLSNKSKGEEHNEVFGGKKKRMRTDKGE